MCHGIFATHTKVTSGVVVGMGVVGLTQKPQRAPKLFGINMML